MDKRKTKVYTQNHKLKIFRAWIDTPHLEISKTNLLKINNLNSQSISS